MNKFYLLIGLAFFSWTANAQFTCAQADANPITTGITTVTEVVSGQVPFPECAENFGQLRFGGRWYKFTATIDGVGKVTSDLATNPTVDTRLHIYSGTCSTLACEGGNDDKDPFANNRFSEVLWPITAGVSYYIAWDNQYSEDGFDFELTETAMTCPDGSTPLTSDFDSDMELVLCYVQEDVDGNGSDWKLQILDINGDNIEEDYATTGTNSPNAKEDWLFSPKLSLSANSSYLVNFKYNGANGSFPANENLEVLLVDAQNSSAAVLQSLYSESNITSTGNFSQAEELATVQSIPYTSTVTGDYYLAFKATSPEFTGSLLLFEYSVTQQVLSIEETLSNVYKHKYNSSKETLTIEASTTTIESIKIINLLGQEVLKRTINSNQARINLSHLGEGIYLTQVRGLNNQTRTFKLLKK
ncbi:MAG: T9SS type A sorting domain-containing protein [Flavobacteriaceae bacterium]|nr:T9SS type A sorting domain-containing protein [Flavobacteriaceae bacterium]